MSCGICFDDVGDRLVQSVGRLLVERADPDIADVAAIGVEADRLDLDDFALDRDVDRLVGALALDLQLGGGVDRPLHLVDGLLQGQALNRVAVDVGDQIARHDAGLRGRRAIHRRDHLDEAIFHRDLDAEAAELAVRGLLHVVPGLLVHVARMRIERGDHAVDGALDQLGVVGLLDIVGPDPLEHVAEQIELRIDVGVGRRPGGRDPELAPGPVTRRVRQVPATAPRKKTEFLRIVREPSRCQLLPTGDRVNSA